jgi:phospholipid/cholesterol/gamma-HCH transport system substrate-binding protein
MQIDGRFTQVPDDSTASILTAGLLGENYIGIDAGGSDTFLKQGSRIQYTQSALVLEKLIGQFFSKATAPGSK